MADTFVVVIKILASLSALYMCFSPTTSIIHIHRSQSTGLTKIIPLAALWGCNHMWMLYGYVTDNVFPLLTTYAVGDVLCLLFIGVYYRWSQEKAYVRKVCAITLVINAIVTIYAVLAKANLTNQTYTQMQNTVGFIAIGSSILLYASPFSAISYVIKSKNSAAIPIAMCLIGALNNTLWIIYGFLIDDLLLIIPTVINVVLGIIQIVLYVFYHPRVRRFRRQTLNKTNANGPSHAVVMGPATKNLPRRDSHRLSYLASPGVVIPVYGEHPQASSDASQSSSFFQSVRPHPIDPMAPMGPVSSPMPSIVDLATMPLDELRPLVALASAVLHAAELAHQFTTSDRPVIAPAPMICPPRPPVSTSSVSTSRLPSVVELARMSLEELRALVAVASAVLQAQELAHRAQAPAQAQTPVAVERPSPVGSVVDHAATERSAMALEDVMVPAPDGLDFTDDAVAVRYENASMQQEDLPAPAPVVPEPPRMVLVAVRSLPPALERVMMQLEDHCACQFPNRRRSPKTNNNNNKPANTNHKHQSARAVRKPLAPPVPPTSAASSSSLPTPTADKSPSVNC